MLKPLVFLSCALLAAALSARPGTGTPGEGRGSPEAATSSASARTELVTAIMPPATVPAPSITSISPATMAPGREATITGRGFVGQQRSVTVAGVSVRVKSATPTQLVVELPRGGFACRPERSASVEVRVNGQTGHRNHPLRAAEFVDIAPGEARTPTDLGLAHCVELAQTEGRYWVGVVNAEPDRVSRGFLLEGSVGRPMPSDRVTLAPDSGLVRSRARRTDEAVDLAEPIRLAGRPHTGFLPRERLDVGSGEEQDVRLPPRLAGVPIRPRPLPRVDDLETMRIWRTADDCTTYEPVTARVVYVGSRAIIYEDVNAPLARSMDDDYRGLGMEFDTLMWDIVTLNFGNPLAMDARLDADGRVRMLFSPRVEKLDPESFGYVTECDFSIAQGATVSSNVGEVIYQIVPHDSAARPAWLREARGITIHELKHLTAFAERLSRGGSREDLWLEEGTAMIAQELLARRYSRASQKANVSYDSALACEYTTDEPRCSRMPQAVSTAFASLNQYLREPEIWSPLERGWKTYGPAWSMVRWAADLSARPESEFLATLTRETTAYGADNLAKITRRPFPELLVDWYVATILDDHAGGSAPPPPKYQMRSWNTRDVFSKLHRMDSNYFPSQFPLEPPVEAFGAFRFGYSDLPSGSAAVHRDLRSAVANADAFVAERGRVSAQGQRAEDVHCPPELKRRMQRLRSRSLSLNTTLRTPA